MLVLPFVSPVPYILCLHFSISKMAPDNSCFREDMSIQNGSLLITDLGITGAEWEVGVFTIV